MVLFMITINIALLVQIINFLLILEAISLIINEVTAVLPANLMNYEIIFYLLKCYTSVKVNSIIF